MGKVKKDRHLAVGDEVKIDRTIKGVGGMTGQIIRASTNPNFDFVVSLARNGAAPEGTLIASFKKSELFRV